MKYKIIDLITDKITRVNEKELVELLRKHIIHYHHSRKMYCYTKKKIEN